MPRFVMPPQTMSSSSEESSSYEESDDIYPAKANKASHSDEYTPQKVKGKTESQAYSSSFDSDDQSSEESESSESESSDDNSTIMLHMPESASSTPQTALCSTKQIQESPNDRIRKLSRLPPNMKCCCCTSNKTHFDDALEQFYTTVMSHENVKEKQADDAHLLDNMDHMNPIRRNDDETTTIQVEIKNLLMNLSLEQLHHIKQFIVRQNVSTTPKSALSKTPSSLPTMNSDMPIHPVAALKMSLPLPTPPTYGWISNMTNQPSTSNTSTSTNTLTVPSSASNILKTTKFQSGQMVYYKSSGYTGPAEIVQVHFDDALEPFYTIVLTDDNGKEKQTDDAHLSDYADYMNGSSNTMNQPTKPYTTSTSNVLKPTKFQSGQKVYYKSSGYTGPAEIIKVHFDDALEPFYTIVLTDENGKEKQTDDAHLSDYADYMNGSSNTMNQPTTSNTSSTTNSRTAPSSASNVLKPTTFQSGQKVYYKSSGYTGPAEIIKVHFDDALEPFYTIVLTDENGKEKQTDDAHLSDYADYSRRRSYDDDTTALQEEIKNLLMNLSMEQLHQIKQFIVRLKRIDKNNEDAL